MKVNVVMGVSGVDKTTGKLLAGRLQLPFFDAEDFHPEENVEKMRKGFPPEDIDPQVWLRRLSDKIVEWTEGVGTGLACSALIEKYRK